MYLEQQLERQRHSTGFKFDGCPGWGPQETPADASHPGEDVVDYAAHFDVDGARPTRIDNGRFPNSQRLFRKLFSR